MGKRAKTYKPVVIQGSCVAGEVTRKVGKAILAHGRTNGVDLVFIDPPFNIGVEYHADGTQDKRSWVDYQTFIRQMVAIYYQLLRPGGAIWLHVPDEVVSLAYDQLMRLGGQFQNWVVLHQQFGQFNDARFIRSKVHGLYFTRPGGERTFNVQDACEPSIRLRMGDKRITTSALKGMRPFLDVWYGPNLGRVQGNNVERRKGHHNQLPEMYLARIIRALTNPVDVVLDPTAGSGTTAVVAMGTGRRSIAVEQSAKYCESIKQRVRKGCIRDVNGQLWEDTTNGKFDKKTK